MIVGAETNDVEAVRMIERLGATVVADSHSSGARHFWNDVSENEDPTASIADRYMDKIPLPQMDFPERRSVRYAVDVALEIPCGWGCDAARGSLRSLPVGYPGLERKI